MICPNCGSKMSAGKIKSRREIIWSDNQSDMEKRNSFELQWSWCTADAERCEECNMLLGKTKFGFLNYHNLLFKTF